MNNKTKIVFLIYIFTIIISSCCKTDTFNVQITDVEFNPINIFVLENETFEFKIITNDSIVGMTLNSFDLKLIPSAYAYDCDDEDSFVPIENINDIKMKVLTDFSDNYQTNDFITDIITVRHYNWQSQEIETKTLTVFLNLLRQDESATGRNTELQDATYIITERPTIGSEQQFELQFELTNNTTLTTITEIIPWE